MPGHSLKPARTVLKKGPPTEHTQACLKCEYYPYHLVLNDVALEFVAEGFLSFKYLSQGLSFVFGQKRRSWKKLSDRIEFIEG